MSDSDPTARWLYDVALSFAGEDRDLALALAARLHAAGHRVFFDRFEEMWGEDLAAKLHDVYGTQARYCVVLVSRHYLEKPWTNHERRILLARTLRDASPFLLPIRVDGSELPGLPAVIAYKDLRVDSLDEIFESLEMVLAKDRRRAGARAAFANPARALELVTTDFLYAVVHLDTPDVVRFNLAYYMVNHGEGDGTVERLEATLTPEDDRGVQLVWNASIAIGPTTMRPDGSGQLPIVVPVGRSRLSGAQFTGPGVPRDLVWRPGTHRVEIVGWTTRARSHEPDFATRFRVDVSELDAQMIAEGAELPLGSGPVRVFAVAIPLTISSVDR